ncbi:MAG: tetratricopeptide repeat protein [Thermoanaerobaculia bacterium]
MSPLRRRRRSFFRVSIALLLAAACGPAGEDGATLVEVPAPDLSELEPTVAAQLSAAATELATAIVEGDPDALGRRYGELGMLYLAYGIHQPAATCFDNAARLAPGEARWPYYRGQALRRFGDPDHAIAAFRRALELAPDNRPATVALGRLLIEADRLAEAAALFDAALDGAGDDPSLHAGRGRVALAARELPLAVHHLERALAIAPQATELHYPLALAYRGMGDPERAQAQLAHHGTGEAPLEDPWMNEIAALARGQRVHQNRGNEALLRGDFETAVAELRRAVAAGPESAVARVNLASALARAGDVAAARAELEQALRLDPDFPLAHFNVGVLLAQEGRDAEAVPHYRRAVALEPGYRDAHFNLGNALRRLGRPAEAEASLRRAIELEPGSGPARYAHALTLIDLERWREARIALDEAHRLLPGDRYLANLLARLLAAAPDPTVRDGRRALALTERLVATERDVLHVEALGKALAEVGRFEEAVRWQEDALAAARRAGQPALESRLAADLDRYRRGVPSRRP